jgi:hypothetical protein
MHEDYHEGSKLTAFPHHHLPANLQVERKGAHENPHDSTPATSENKCPRDCARTTAMHAVRSDFVGALVRICTQRNDEAKLVHR